MVIWSRIQIPDHFSTSRAVVEKGILGDLLAFLIHSPTNFHDSWQNDWSWWHNVSTTLWEWCSEHLFLCVLAVASVSYLCACLSACESVCVWSSWYRTRRCSVLSWMATTTSLFTAVTCQLRLLSSAHSVSSSPSSTSSASSSQAYLSSRSFLSCCFSYKL